MGYRSTSATDAGDGTSVTQRGSLISGDNVYLDAGRDLGILGSTVVAEGDLGLKAVRNIDIVSTQNSSEQSSESRRSESGVLGGFDRPSIGTISVNQDGQGQNVEQVGSMIGSLGGNVNIDAGGRYTQTASDVTAAAGFAGSANGDAGNIVIRAGEVLINEAMNTAGSQQHASERKTAIGPTMDIPLLNAAKSLRDVAQAAGETSDGRSQAMAAATIAMQASDIASGVQGAIANPESLQAGFKVGFALSASRSESSMSQQSETSVGSTVRGSRNVTIVASGIDGDESAGNITVIGSQVEAGGNVVLSALDRIDLLASKDTFTQTSNSSSSGASIGIGLVAGGTQNGLTFELAANRARADADGTDTIYRNTHIEGGNGVTLISGGDTTLRGATITAPTVNGLIGGDLTITSLQDISRFDSKQSSAGISASLCIPPFCSGVSYRQGHELARRARDCAESRRARKRHSHVRISAGKRQQTADPATYRVGDQAPTRCRSRLAKRERRVKGRELDVSINGLLVGQLSAHNDLWQFAYDSSWVKDPSSFDLSPTLTREIGVHVDGASNRPVQWYFDNLLPEENLRTVIAKEVEIDAEDAFGLLAWFGAESAGSLILSDRPRLRRRTLACACFPSRA